MFGLFKKKADGARAEIRKVENRDLMQAIVGGCLLVAASDGEIEAAEVAKLDDLIRANPALAHFGSEITATINRFTAQLNASYQVGRLAIKREINDVKNTPSDAEEVFVNMLAIAESDGEIEPAELAVLKEVGLHLGVRPADFGVEV